MNRYIERAENVARFIHVNLHLMLDMPDGGTDQWQPLIWTTGDEKDFQDRYGKATQENVLQFLTFDIENPNSILSCVRKARENARTVREVISSEMWETLNSFYLVVNDPNAPARSAKSPHDFYTEIKTAGHLFSGVTHGTMSHGEGWHFGRLGQLLERADKTSRILDVKYFILLPKVDYIGTSIDTIQWAALLKSASALEMFRKRFSTITPRTVSQFLILDREFPRAIIYCLMKAQESMQAINGSAAGTFSNIAEQRLGRLCAELNYAQVDELLKSGLHEYLDHLQVAINQTDDAIRESFFTLNIGDTSAIQVEGQ
jgi:uncharacterized alpha-E superfamily protein